MTSRAWLVFGLLTLLLGIGVVWIGYGRQVVYQNERHELVQGSISRAASAAADPEAFRAELGRLIENVKDGETGLSPESKLDAERTAEALMDDVGRVDSTEARLTLMRLVARIERLEESPDRTVGKAGLLLIAGSIAMFLRSAARRGKP